MVDEDGKYTTEAGQELAGLSVLGDGNKKGKVCVCLCVCARTCVCAPYLDILKLFNCLLLVII